MFAMFLCMAFCTFVYVFLYFCHVFVRGEKKQDWRGGKKRRVGGLAAACLDGKDISPTSFAVKTYGKSILFHYKSEPEEVLN